MGKAINEDELFFHHVRSKDLEGSQQILALKNPVLPEQQEAAKEWLKKQQQKDPPNSSVYQRKIPLEDIRTLDPRYFVGHLEVEGRKEIKRLDGHKDHLPKQVKFPTVISPRTDISAEEIQRAIKRAVLKGNTIL